MRRVVFHRGVILAILLHMLICLSACNSSQIREYYANRDSYVTATGVITRIDYNEEHTVLYLGLSDLTPAFDDHYFKIVGESVTVVQKNKIDEILKEGTEIKFVTAPRYFGDGYVMPIVAISVNGEVLLEFEEGYVSLLEWIDSD